MRIYRRVKGKGRVPQEKIRHIEINGRLLLQEPQKGWGDTFSGRRDLRLKKDNILRKLKAR